MAKKKKTIKPEIIDVINDLRYLQESLALFGDEETIEDHIHFYRWKLKSCLEALDKEIVEREVKLEANRYWGPKDYQFP
jgi:hypothetical protein